jgi:multicomponent Na+:H+ antiporter subunit G
MNTLTDILTDVLIASMLVLGGLFCLLAAVGMLRMPDLYTRLQAATKAGTLGVGLIALAVILHFASLPAVVRGILTILFLFLTAPVAAHVIARAAHTSGVPLWNRSSLDDLNNTTPAQPRRSQSQHL